MGVRQPRRLRLGLAQGQGRGLPQGHCNPLRKQPRRGVGAHLPRAVQADFGEDGQGLHVHRRALGEREGSRLIPPRERRQAEPPERQAVFLRAASPSREHGPGPVGVGQRQGPGDDPAGGVPERRRVLRALPLLHHRRAQHLAGGVHVRGHQFAEVHLLAVLARQRRGPQRHRQADEDTA